MKKYPKTISILEAAKALNCESGHVSRGLGMNVVTGNEHVAFDALAEAFKVPQEILAGFINGTDKAITRQQTAAMLGVKSHCLNIVNRCRATIVPVAHLGPGRGSRVRYSRKAVEAHLGVLS